MKVWDYIFPKNHPVIIWGAGGEGRKWLAFLQTMNREIVAFFDQKAKVMKSINGIDVQYPSSCMSTNTILLISPRNHVEEIYKHAVDLGYENIKIGNILKYIPRYFEIEIDNTFPPFGHFYSLYPDFNEIDKRYNDILLSSKSKDNRDAINMNDNVQCLMLEKMNGLYETLPQWQDYGSDTKSQYRYRKNNLSMGISDSMVLHFMIRLLKPRNFIEVGSGWSSAVSLDTNEYYLSNEINMKFIEPYPELFYSVLKSSDNKQALMIPQKLQDIPLDFFEALEENDILFIDSTHVSKCGSDVNYLFFHVLPRLKRGIYVHLHDIFYPWQYPLSWIKKGMGWNEMFLLRSFLQYNNSWEIIFFNHYMSVEYPNLYHEKWRNIKDLGGGSFWMRKVK